MSIEIGMTFNDTDTGQEVTIPFRDFTAKPLPLARFNQVVQMCYDEQGEEHVPGQNRMRDLEAVTAVGYLAFRQKFAVWQRANLAIDEL